MKQLFFIVIFIFLVFVFAIYVLWPQYKEFSVLDRKVGQMEENLAQTKGYYESLVALKEKLKNYEIALEKIDSALPKTNNLPSLFNVLSQKVLSSGLVLKSVSPAKATNKVLAASQDGSVEGQNIPPALNPAIQESYVNLEILGPVSAFEDFLRSLEKSARLIEVQELSLSKSENAKDKFPSFSLLLKTYSY